MARNAVPWLRVFAEGVVIVVSILLAFSLDAYWTERVERRLAATYREDVLLDLAADSSAHHRWSNSMDDKVDAIESLLADLNGTGPRLSPTEALSALSTAALVPTLQISDATYRDLIGSGNLRILTPEHRRGVVQYYSAAATVDRALSLYEQQGKPPFTGLIPGRLRGSGPDCWSRPGACYAEAELEVVAAWRSRATIREELQLERGNAALSQLSLRRLGAEIAAFREVLGG